MARGLNKVMLIGNLGRDPEVRYTPNGLAVANLAVATSESWTDKKTGDTQEHTEWHRVVMYQQLAEIASKYLRKGSKVYLEGRLKTRKWLDKNTNQERYTTEIIADRMLMLDSKNTNIPSGADDEFLASTQAQQSSAAGLSLMADTNIANTNSTQFSDEDIPF